MSTTHLGDGTLVCVVGYATLHVEVDGQTWPFEWRDLFGPQLLGKHGQPIKAPPERSHFWDALRWWERQGKRRTPDGLCLWSPMPDEEVVEHVAGRHHRITGYRIPAWAEGQGTVRAPEETT